MDILSDRSPQTFFAQHTGVRFIRFQWIDLSGILRTRMVTRQHCEHLIESVQFLAVSVTLMLFPVSALQISKTPATGCAELRPNWASLRICMYAEAHASVMCSFYVRGADHPYSLCPYSTLEGVLHKAEATFNKTFLVGFEVEFLVLTDKYESIGGVNQITTNSTTSGLRSKLLEALERTVSILEGSGITVQTVHTEGPSQLEIATGPLPPLEAIASLVYTHETIKTVFASYDLHATMAPSVSSDGTTTGAHVHISMCQPQDEEAFLAGILHQLGTISAFGLANFDSFTRVRDFMNATGTWVSWGVQHRDVPLRKVDEAHWEVRCIDATANPFVTLSLIISAGLRGLAQARSLLMHDLSEYSSNMKTSELREAGIEEQLPKHMADTIETISKASMSDLPFDQTFKEAYLAIKSQDVEALRTMHDQERRLLFLQSF